MLKVKEILRLTSEHKLSTREIARACSYGKSTVAEILDRAEGAGITWPLEVNAKQLMSLLLTQKS